MVGFVPTKTGKTARVPSGSVRLRMIASSNSSRTLSGKLGAFAFILSRDDSDI